MSRYQHTKNLQQVISKIYAATEDMSKEEYLLVQSEIRDCIHKVNSIQWRLIDYLYAAPTAENGNKN